MCLSFFPPSAKFQILLERYISLQSNAEKNATDLPISIYAKVCQKRLEKILQTGPKKGLKKPTYEEIELSKVRRRWLFAY
jgi:Rho GTPase-activating protein 39